MKIIRAMKERSRLEGEIKDIKHRMEKCLNTIKGNDLETVVTHQCEITPLSYVYLKGKLL